MKTSRYLLLALGCLLSLSCAASDPCEGQTGSCLRIEIQGSVGQMDSIRLELQGAVRHQFTSRPQGGGGIALPAAIGVLLPNGTMGSLSLSGVGLLADQVVATGMAQVEVTSERPTATLTLATAGDTCLNGYRDGDETDQDCGGRCNACAAGFQCKENRDCAGGLCTDGRCLAVGCTNKVRDGAETDVDCGGAQCGACANYATCSMDRDCLSSSCVSGRCAPSTPAVTGLTPNAGPTIGSTQITLNGQGFVNGPGLAVEVGGAAAQMVRWVSATQVQAVVPDRPGKTGAAVVRLTNPDGASTTAPSFTYNVFGKVEFDKGMATALTTAPQAVLLRDLNLDRILDAAFATSAGSVHALLGNGKGGWSSVQNIGVSSTCTSIATGDLNGDRRPDLVTSCQGGSAGVYMLTGTSSGTFNPATKIASTVTPTGVVVANFDNTREMDVAVSRLDTNALQIFQNNGTGIFTLFQTITVAAGETGRALQAGLIDAGTYPDVALGLYNSASNTSRVLILLNNGSGALNSYYATNNFTGSISAMTVGDLNGDKNLDLVTCQGNANTVLVFLGKGTGVFDPAVAYSVTGTPQGVALGDANGDGALDVAVSTQSGRSAVLFNTGKGDGRLNPTPLLVPSPFSDLRDVAMGDLDEDGKDDLVTAGGQASVHLNLSQ